MLPFTIFRSRFDPKRIVVVALVNKDGTHQAERFEIEDSQEALDNLLHGLYGEPPDPKKLGFNPISLTGCRQCECCGDYIVSYDSPDMIPPVMD